MDTYVDLDQPWEVTPAFKTLQKKKIDDLMKTSTNAGFPLEAEKSLRQKKRERRAERSRTKGKGWFNMEAPEMTEEKKNDLMVLQMRGALDPKRFYKAPDLRALPKFVEFGTIVESKADFYSSRVVKKERKANLVEELLADAEFKQYRKRKCAEIQSKKMQRRKKTK